MKITEREVDNLFNAYYQTKDWNEKGNIFFTIDDIVKAVKKEDRPKNFFKLTNILVLG